MKYITMIFSDIPEGREIPYPCTCKHQMGRKKGKTIVCAKCGNVVNANASDAIPLILRPISKLTKLKEMMNSIPEE